MPSRPTIAKVALPVPLSRVFDYQIPESIPAIEPGTRVRVPFGARKMIGVVMETVDTSELAPAKLKKVAAVLDTSPVLPEDLLSLLRWAASYYHHPLGEVIQAALPGLLRQDKPASIAKTESWQLSEAGRQADAAELKRAPLQQRVFVQLQQAPVPIERDALVEISAGWRTAINALVKKGWVERLQTDDLVRPAEEAITGPELNPEQAQAIEKIRQASGTYKTFLLNGVTGSGKTEVYLGAMQPILAMGQQVLMLVPEIGLTPQLVHRVRQRVNVPVLVLHSGLTDIQRNNAWLQAAQGAPAVILGTRSAVFTSMPNLGLVIVDEEHDQSYKQHDGFRYHARDLAVMRANKRQVAIVLGSATPALESMYNVKVGNYDMLRLSARAGDAALPRLGLLDMKQHSVNDGLSPPLIKAIQQRLDKSEQSLLFLNRRGYAPVIMCTACGWTQSCPRCDAHMIMHRHKRLSRCHHCASETPLPEKCPSCGQGDLKPIGEGTERVEESLRRLFPAARIDRIDRDTTTKKGALEEKLNAIRDGKVDIVIGTQMLSKGHDFPMITLVGVLNADQGLYGTDFRGPENLIQQVMQVSGRAGRADRSGEVLVQTFHPEHTVFQALMKHDYEQFVESALQERKQAGFPPYTYITLMRAEATEPGRAIEFLASARRVGLRYAEEGKDLQLMDAVSAPMEKRAGRYRAQLLIKSNDRASLHNFLSRWLPEIEASPASRKVRWSVDVDAIDMY